LEDITARDRREREREKIQLSNIQKREERVKKTKRGESHAAQETTRTKEEDKK